MRTLIPFSLSLVLVACQGLAQESPNFSLPAPGVCPAIGVRPSLPMLLVANYEGSLSEALEESALTEEEQMDFLVDLQATMTVKQAKLELLRVIHQLEVIEKKCKGTAVADEAAQLLRVLPQRKDLQPGQSPTATMAARKKSTALRQARTPACDAATVK